MLSTTDNGAKILKVETRRKISDPLAPDML